MEAVTATMPYLSSCYGLDKLVNMILRTKIIHCLSHQEAVVRVRLWGGYSWNRKWNASLA